MEKKGFVCHLHLCQSRFQFIIAFFKILFSDIIIFQKCFSRYHHILLSVSKLLNKATYLDIDDAPSPNESPITIDNFDKFVSKSHGVLAGSQALVNYCQPKNNNTFLIPSSIKLSNYPLGEKQKLSSSSRIHLGWIGNGKQYREDLISILVDPLTRLAAEYPIHFYLIGACYLEEIHDTFEAIPNLSTEIKDQIDWSDPSKVLSEIHTFDIGLYPLLNNNYNRYKCGFKALEYMALGKPVVASPIGANSLIINHEADGLLASNPNEWYKCIEKLIHSPELRSTMGKAGRSKVEMNYNTEAAADLIIRAINIS